MMTNPMKTHYKVISHCGESIQLSTRAMTGTLFLEPGMLTIAGEQRMAIPFDSLRSVELFRLHGTARMLKVVHIGGTLFVSVIRFSLFRGYFAVINFFATGRLRDELNAAIKCKGSSIQGLLAPAADDYSQSQ